MPSVPLFSGDGLRSGDVELEDAVFAAELRRHLVHETVRAEANAARAGTRGAKSRGMVAGGRSKPWRQKGTGRARQGTVRAPHYVGGGLAFPPTMRSFALKVNRKARRSALRGALSHHVGRGTLAVLAAGTFSEPSTRRAAELLGGWEVELPALVVCAAGEDAVSKSFRNLERVAVVSASDLEVGAVVWARALLLTEAALEHVRKVAAP